MKLLDTIPVYKKFKCHNVINDLICRAVREDENTVFVYAKNKRRYGYRMENKEFLNLYEILPEKDENEEWHKRIARAVRLLENSELWSDHIIVLKNLDSMNYEDLKKIRSYYWVNNRNVDDFWTEQMSKYPFIADINKDGSLHISTEYLSEGADVILKSMYFGRSNRFYKNNIKQALIEKSDYRTPRVTVGYDVTFSYNAASSKAWYCEEYRNCGNGHYYIALDENTALFIEND